MENSCVYTLRSFSGSWSKAIYVGATFSHHAMPENLWRKGREFPNNRLHFIKFMKCYSFLLVFDDDTFTIFFVDYFYAFSPSPSASSLLRNLFVVSSSCEKLLLMTNDGENEEKRRFEFKRSDKFQSFFKHKTVIHISHKSFFQF